MNMYDVFHHWRKSISLFLCLILVVSGILFTVPVGKVGAYGPPTITISEDILVLNSTSANVSATSNSSSEEFGFVYSVNEADLSLEPFEDLYSIETVNVIVAEGQSNSFNATLNNLLPGTTYYVLAFFYYNTEEGYTFSSIVSFKTPPSGPIVTTIEPADNITNESAKVSGEISNIEENNEITKKGIEYSRNNDLSESIDFEDTRDGFEISVDLEGLDSYTEYYYRAYVVINGNTIYGEIKSFKTLNDPPSISKIDNITIVKNSITGEITFTIGDDGTSPEQLVVTVDSSDTSVIASEGLTLGGSGADRTITITPITNATGTAEITITVKDALNASSTTTFTVTVSDIAPPIVSTKDPATNITQTSATVSGEVTSDGGDEVTERGIQYWECIGCSEQNAPASTNGSGEFSVNLTGLVPGATYYARAYATNSAGTTYGDEITFTTQQKLPTYDPPTRAPSTEVTVIITDPTQGGTVVPDPITKLIGQQLSLQGTLLDKEGNPMPQSELTMDASGKITMPNVPAGEYQMVLYVIAPTGEKLAGQIATLTVDNKGNATLEAELIDPYGIITDAISGLPIEGVKVTLHWSDTQLNKSKGRIVDELVILPILPDFPPNQNHDPQFSTASGEYGWMVFPDGDYYILAEKEGYEPFDSRKDMRNEKQGEDSYIRDGIIHVGVSIVKYDFMMQPKILESGVHQPYMLGYTDGTFKPERGIARSEVAAILSRIFSTKQSDSSVEQFADVPTTHWALKEILTAAQQNWMIGDQSGRFKPEQWITRAEFAQVLMNVMKWEPVNVSAYTDIKGHWAEIAIATIEDQGLLMGDYEGKFYPDQIITRAEAVVLFNQLLGRRPVKVHSDKNWPDVLEMDKYFNDIMEASFEHSYVKYVNGFEVWTK